MTKVTENLPERKCIVDLSPLISRVGQTFEIVPLLDRASFYALQSSYNSKRSVDAELLDKIHAFRELRDFFDTVSVREFENGYQTVETSTIKAPTQSAFDLSAIANELGCSADELSDILDKASIAIAEVAIDQGQSTDGKDMFRINTLRSLRDMFINTQTTIKNPAPVNSDVYSEPKPSFVAAKKIITDFLSNEVVAAAKKDLKNMLAGYLESSLCQASSQLDRGNIGGTFNNLIDLLESIDAYEKGGEI